MPYQPDQQHFDTSREIHAQLTAKLIELGEQQEDGTNLYIDQPDGPTVRLSSYWTVAHKEFTYREQNSMQRLLSTGKAVLMAFVEGNELYRPIYIYQPHRINPKFIGGSTLHDLALTTPEDAFTVALLDKVEGGGHDTKHLEDPANNSFIRLLLED